MVWSAPMTAVAGNIFKASEFNTYVRDNLMETEAAYILEPGYQGAFFVTTGENSISGSAPQISSISTSESTTSTTYTDLATASPTILNRTVNTKTLITLGAIVSNSSATGTSIMSVEWSNDSGVVGAASDLYSFSGTGTNPVAAGAGYMIDTVPGTYTFRAKYRVTSGTGTFAQRRLFVFPF